MEEDFDGKWPIADAFVSWSLSKYAEECESVGLHVPYTQRHETIEEGCEPTSPAVSKANERAAANYAVECAREPSSTGRLVSPRFYELSKSAIDHVEKCPEDEFPAIDPKTTYPWKKYFDQASGLDYWVDVESGGSTWYEPKLLWERKLELLERVKPAGHVSRAKERSENVVVDEGFDAALRRSRRLDARPDGWEWEEDEREGRRRRFARRAQQQAEHAAREKRRREPTEVEAIADLMASMVDAVCDRHRRHTLKDRLRRARAERACWHPACGSRHMRKLANEKQNFVREKYRDVYLTSDGQVLPAPVKLVAESKEKSRSSWLPDLLRFSRNDDDSNKSLTISPTNGPLSRKLSDGDDNAGFVSIKLNLAHSVPPPYKKRRDGTLDARERTRFEIDLRCDVARTAQVATKHVVLDELISVRSAGRPAHRENAKRLLATAKITIIAKTPLAASVASSRLLRAAADKNSAFRRHGKVSRFCIGSSGCCVVEELRQRSWEQYWIHSVSPVFWGRDPRTFAVVFSSSQNQLIGEVDEGEKHPASVGPACLTPPQYTTTLMRRQSAAIRAEKVASDLSKGKKRYDMCGREAVSPEQLWAQRKATRARRTYRDELNKYERRLRTKSPKAAWWDRPKISPHSTFDAAAIASGADSEQQTCRDLATKREARKEKRKARLRANAWREQKRVVERWLVDKLAASHEAETQAFYEAINTAVAESWRASAPAAVRQEEMRVNEAELRRVHQDVSENLALGSREVRKRDIVNSIERNKVASLFRPKEFTVAFLRAPVARPGYVTAEELVIFGLVAAQIQPLYARAKELLAVADEEEKAIEPVEEVPKEEEALVNKAEEETWHSMHCHLFVRTPFHRGPYCSLCRRRREAERAERRARIEKDWNFEEFLQARLHELSASIVDAVDRRRTAITAQIVARNEVRICVREMVDGIAIIRETTADVLEAATKAIKTTIENHKPQELHSCYKSCLSRMSLRKTATLVCAQSAFVSRASAVLRERAEDIESEIDSLKRQFAREERERAALASEEAWMRRVLDANQSSVERPLEAAQQEGRMSMESVLSTLVAEERCPTDLARLRWIETVYDEVHLCEDPASGSRVFLRIMRVQDEGTAQRVVEKASELKHLRRRIGGLAKVLSFHDMRLDNFNILGVCYGVTWLVAVVTQAIDGARLDDVLMSPEPPNLREATPDRLRAYARDVRRPKCDPKDLIRWIQQVGNTLANLHANKLVHGNLHPGSVFIDQTTKKVMLDDFSFFDDSPQRLTYDGFVESSPGRALSTSAADIWAFGCCIYAWIVGNLPLILTQRDSASSDPASFASRLNRLLDDNLPDPFSKRSCAIGTVLRFALQPHETTRAKASQLVSILQNA